MRKDSPTNNAVSFLRKATGLGLNELSRLAGLHPVTLSRIERGVQQPTPKTLAAVRQAIVGIFLNDDVAAARAARPAFVAWITKKERSPLRPVPLRQFTKLYREQARAWFEAFVRVLLDGGEARLTAEQWRHLLGIGQGVLDGVPSEELDGATVYSGADVGVAMAAALQGETYAAYRAREFGTFEAAHAQEAQKLIRAIGLREVSGRLTSQHSARREIVSRMPAVLEDIVGVASGDDRSLTSREDNLSLANGEGRESTTGTQNVPSQLVRSAR